MVGDIRADVLQPLAGRFERLLKLASHPARPADFEHAPAPVVYDSGLVLMRASRFGQTIDIDVIQPGPDGLLELALRRARAQHHGAVNVNFGMHG